MDKKQYWGWPLLGLVVAGVICYYAEGLGLRTSVVFFALISGIMIMYHMKRGNELKELKEYRYFVEDTLDRHERGRAVLIKLARLAERTAEASLRVHTLEHEGLEALKRENAIRVGDRTHASVQKELAEGLKGMQWQFFTYLDRARQFTQGWGISLGSNDFKTYLTVMKEEKSA